MTRHEATRAAGYEPNDFVDPPEGWRAHFLIPDDPTFVKGCVIGDGTACTAAKAILDQIREKTSPAEWVFVGATTAWIAFKSGTKFRVRHSGAIAKAQDKNLMPPPGVYTLRPVAPRELKKNYASRSGTRDGSRPECGERSVAAVLRA